MEKWFNLLTVDMTPANRRALIAFFWRAAVVAHISIACGWVTWLGVGGFAWAKDVEQIKRENSSIRVELIENRLFEARLRNCSANSAEAKRFYAEKVQELVRKYRDASGADYRLPQCDEVIL